MKFKLTTLFLYNRWYCGETIAAHNVNMELPATPLFFFGSFLYHWFSSSATLLSKLLKIQDWYNVQWLYHDVTLVFT